jgi:hypothetical protein
LECLNKGNISTKLCIDKEAGIIKIYSKEYNMLKRRPLDYQRFLNYRMLLQNIIHMRWSFIILLKF